MQTVAVNTMWAVIFFLLRRRRARRAGVSFEARLWKELHGRQAYGLARDRVIEAMQSGDRAAERRWGAIRHVIGHMDGRW